MKENKAISKLFDILEWIVTAGLLLLIILVGVQKFSEAGNFFGYRIYIVASGSMIPTYNIGDTLLVKQVPMEEFKIGDAVTYKGETAGVDGLVITHQVQKVEKDEKGKYVFHTKGIANNIEDPMVYEEQVLGKVTHKFVILSILGRIITNRLLLLLGIMLPMALLVAIEIIKLVYRKDDEEYDKLLDVEGEEEKPREKKKEEKSKIEDVSIESVTVIDDEEEKPVTKSETTIYRELVERVKGAVEEALEAREAANKKVAKKPTPAKKKYYKKNTQNNAKNNQNNKQNNNQKNKQATNQNASQKAKQNNKKKYYYTKNKKK